MLKSTCAIIEKYIKVYAIAWYMAIIGLIATAYVTYGWEGVAAATGGMVLTAAYDKLFFSDPP